MALKTGRFFNPADVTIKDEKCISCGMCTKVCKGAPLYMEDGKVKVDHNRVFGCIACGHCMTVCPTGAIEVNGRGMSPKDIVEMPPKESCSDYEKLKSLLISRRSCREYKDKPVEKELIEKILEVAATAPNGLAASDVEVLVLDGNEKVKEFCNDLIKVLKKVETLVSPTMIAFMRPFMKKDTYESLKTFVSVAIETFISKQNEGRDWLLYSAPVAMYFSCPSTADPADSDVAATYAMLAAESLGLGSTMIGTVSVILMFSSKKLKKKYGIPLKNKKGIMVLFGHPDVKYNHAIIKRFAGINYY